MPTTLTNSYPRLLGDVGGTNARFAIQYSPQKELVNHQTYKCANYPGLQEVIECYLYETGGPHPQWGAIGIANPVTSDWISMTNHHWQFSIAQLQNNLGLHRLLMLNDYTALALALPLLSSKDKIQIGGGSPRDFSAIGLLGPGTGLGVSGLVPLGKDYAPLQGEGGHVTLAAFDERETALVAHLQKHYGHISAERILSGPGLVDLYQGCAKLRGVNAQPLTPAEISERAITASCPLCVEALEIFCAMLGTVAANLALILGALGGVYIGGGIVPKLGNFFARSPFRARFEDKGRFSEYLSQIPTYVINAEYPSLLGAAAKLDKSV